MKAHTNRGEPTRIAKWIRRLAIPIILGWIAVVVAAVAFTFGALQLKDGLAPGRGPSLSIAQSQRPGIYRRMRQVSASDRSIVGVLAGTVAVSVVSFLVFERPWREVRLPARPPAHTV